MLKICTDTYKIIDKNIPLLTIHLGGKPCERLEGGWLVGRGGSWLGGGWGLRGSLGSGATRTWPPPWPLLGLPPPAEQREQNRVRPESHTPGPLGWVGGCRWRGGWGGPRLVGLGLAVLRVVLLVCLCLGVLLCLLGLLVLLLIIHSLFFLQGGGGRTVFPPASWWTTVPLGTEGLLPLLPSWPLVQAWAGPVSTTRIEKNQLRHLHGCLITNNFPLPPP